MVSYNPTSLQEALELRAAKHLIPYAGGTDLMVENRDTADYLFLNRLQELKEIREDEDMIRIGAAVTFTEALENRLVPSIMKEALSQIASPAIRNAGTFGGNLGNGSAKADTVTVEYAMDAKVRLLSVRGERLMDVDRFCLGRKKTDLKEDELIAEILLPKTGLEHYYYEKVGGRQALAISRVSFAGIFAEEDGRIKKLSTAFGAVADTILRFRDLETMLIGKTLEEAKEEKAQFLNAYAEHLNLTEGRVSAEYRRAVCLNLLNAFLEKFGI